jgi:hypothetical protein
MSATAIGSNEINAAQRQNEHLQPKPNPKIAAMAAPTGP